MFYQYFSTLNIICNLFGVSKPHITKGKSVSSNLLIKIWCLSVGGLFIVNYIVPKSTFEIKSKDDLEWILDINDLTANLIVILINIFRSNKVYVNIHKTFNIIFNDFNFDFIIIKSFTLKMYFWFSMPFIMFIVLIFTEIFYKNPPYNLVIRIPTFLSLMYLFMHLYVKLALVKLINNKLSKTLTRSYKIRHDDDYKAESTVKYILDPAVKFGKFNNDIHFDIKLLCKIYDNIGTGVHLLEQINGFEVLISIWLMFTSGVLGMTLIVCNKAAIKWLVIVKSHLPVFWGFIGCCINEQLRTEVLKTNTLIIKCLIDYRCVPTMKPALETFKELVNNDRLQFTACSLFHLSYAMLLGTILNVITYSVILIQMILN